MKTFYNQLFLVPAIMLGIIFGAHFSVQAQGSNLGFTVNYEPAYYTYSGGKSVFVWSVTNNSSKTGLSHFIIQNFCLPTNSLVGENSSDGTNWNKVSVSIDDGSTTACQNQVAGTTFLKFDGSIPGATVNYYRITLNGHFVPVDGYSIIKIGNGQGRTNDHSCEVLSTSVPQVSLPSPLQGSTSTVSVCKGSNTTLTASYAEGGTYKWYKDNVEISNQTGPSITVSEVGTYRVTCAIDACNNFSQEFAVTVTDPPIFALQPSSLCLNGTLTLSSLVTSGSTGGSWSITGGTATISGGVLTATTLNTITLSYSVTEGPCTTTKTTTVTVNALPTVSIANVDPICVGTSATLTASGAASYLWSPGGAITASITVDPTTTTEYTVTGTDGNGCVNTASKSVIVNALSDFTLTSSTICSDGSVDLTTKTTQLGGTWSGTGVSGETFSYATAGTYTLTYTYTNSNNCTTTKTTTVTVNALPTVSIANVDPICVGTSATLTASGAASYLWSPGGAITASITVDPTTTTEYTVTGTGGNGCVNTASKSVIVNALSDFSLTASTVCADGSVNLSEKTTQSGGTWSGTGVSGETFSYATAGTYTLTYTYTNSNNCTTTKTTTVTVNALPDFTLTSSTICSDGSVDLTTKTTQLGGTWSGTGVSGETFSYATAGTYTLTYTYTNSNNCTTTKTTTVTVNALPTVSIANVDPICVGTSATLTASGAASYLWSPGGAITASITVDPTTTMEYTVTGTGGNGCVNTASKSVIVNALSDFSLTASTVCADGSVNLSEKTTQLGGTWSGTGVSGETFSYATAGTYTLTYTYTNSNNCTTTKTTTVTVNPNPTIQISGITTICNGTSTTLSATGATSYVWTPGGEGESITVSPTSNTTYKVVGTTNGCTGSAEVLVVVNPKPSISLASDKSSICAGSKVVLTATNIAGATYNWGSASSSTGNSIEVYPSVNSTYGVKATVNGCTSDEVSVSISVTECLQNFTYTQGFYGNIGGKTCEGYSTAYLLNIALPNGSMMFGKSNRTFTLLASDLTTNIYKLLPGGGTPASLKVGQWNSTLKGGNSPIDSKGKINNNLLSQTITLWFNIRTSDNLGGFVMPNTFTTAKVNCGDQSVNFNDQKTFSVPSALAGKSVDQLFELANKALGAALVNGDPSLNDIYSTIDLINNAFDQGRAVISSTRNNNTSVIKTNNINTMSISAAIPRPQVDVINAYPNPFTDKLSIVITAKASGHASLAIYDASGLKVADMFDGELSLGEERTFEFFAPSGRGVQTYIYHFVQGDQVLQGKLLSL